MFETPDAYADLVFTFAGWLNRRQEDLIDYLREENRVLREQISGRPLQLTPLLQEAGFSDIRVRLIERGQVIWARAYQPQKTAEDARK